MGIEKIEYTLGKFGTHSMSKQLNQMTTEQLGRLFPIILSNPQNCWGNEYLKEKAIVEKTIGKDLLRIEHIGSTAIPGIKAKPTIDILVEIKKTSNVEKLIHQMKKTGYEYSEQPGNPAPHMMFMKGYTLEGFKGQAVHVHVRYLGDWDEIYFRDYLRNDKKTAKEYEKLKIKLQKEHLYNREDYTNGKTKFVKRISDLARRKIEDGDFL